MLNETQIGDVWLTFIEYIDKKQQEVIAERCIYFLGYCGGSYRVLQAATGVDEILDQAIAYYLNDDEVESDDDDDYKELE